MTAMDRWNRFCGRASGAVFAGAVAVGLAASLAVAQDAPPAPAASTQPKAAPPAAPAAQPKTAAPAAPPAAAAQQPAAADEPEKSLWVKLCMKNAQTNEKQICLVNHEGLEPNTGMVLIAAAARTIEGEEKKHLLIRLATVRGLVIPAGVQIKIDEDQPIPLQYMVCLPATCQVQIELTPELMEKMRKGKQMIVAAIDIEQKTLPFPIPLTGFSKAFDGSPVDPVKYQEARKVMMEKFRQQAAELAAKAKVDGGQQQPGAPQPAAPAVPNTSAAPPKTAPAAPPPPPAQ
jgi:invasion protein IalB